MIPLRLFIVDDHNLFRRGLIALFSDDERFAIAGEAADASHAINLCSLVRPDVVLLDNHLPGVTGIEAIAALKEVTPKSKILMLTVSEDEQLLAQALRQGADGYLLKTINIDDLADSILKVAEGESVISPEMTSKLVSVIRSANASAQSQGGQIDKPGLNPAPDRVPSLLEQLSPREREILREIAKGASNKEIARTCDIAETTVKIHVQHILRKLDVSSRVQAAVVAAGFE
jgi:two-component system, NarL family, nitrate/nitrite response regulator NarL